MSIYKCTRCPFTTFSHWLLREHELNRHVNDIKIDPKNPKAPTTVSFGPGAISSDLYRTKKIAEFLNITLDQLKIRLITLSRSEDQENTLGQACFYSFLKL